MWGGQAAAQKAGEFFVTRAVNALVDGVKKAYGGSQVLLGTAFTRYLENATKRYNQVHTIATGDITRSIIGPENIYVSIGVRYGKKTISTDTVDPMLRIGNNLLIQGTGGIGKSMMMRYLFLNTANRGEYVPVLLELRKISRQSPGEISIMDLIFTCLKDFDVELPREQFEFSLRLGKYLFLMDGFDEVKESMAAETADKIQQFCSKYPNNPCIITTRPGRDTAPLETFTTVRSLPLSKDQAVALAQRIWDEDEKTREFCRQLREELYDNPKHREFAENPLLLTMMFLTFMRNNSLPNHLAEFYRQAFDALYSTHDSKNKGAYRREFKCGTLDAPGFKRILSRFCFQSFFNQDYEFSEKKLLQYLQNSITKFGYTHVQAGDYLQDLKKVVCLLVMDGVEYKFAHRSFQTYFAACYTAESLNDEQQKKVLREFVNKGWGYANTDYLELLDQLEHERMTVNLLEDIVRLYLGEAQSSENPIRSYSKMVIPKGFIVERNPQTGAPVIQGYYYIADENGMWFGFYHSLFSKFVMRNKNNDSMGVLFNLINKTSVVERIALNLRGGESVDIALWDLIPFGASAEYLDEFDDTLGASSFKFVNEFGISGADMDDFFDDIARKSEISSTMTDMLTWLESIDEQRKVLAKKSFIEEL